MAKIQKKKNIQICSLTGRSRQQKKKKKKIEFFHPPSKRNREKNEEMKTYGKSLDHSLRFCGATPFQMPECISYGMGVKLCSWSHCTHSINHPIPIKNISSCKLFLKREKKNLVFFDKMNFQRKKRRKKKRNRKEKK